MSGYYAGGHKLKHPYLQQCDPAATIYETIETGGEWASNEDGDGQKWPQEKHGEVNIRNENEVINIQGVQKFV